jgi:fimbrial isopeptide formation D2 family protein/uncharacterized repeat protein (TIGR01451 family)
MKLYLNSLFNFKGSRSRRAIASIGLLLCAIGAGIQPAHAEGSRELVGNGGHRPYTEWRTDKTAGIVRRTLLKVYAKSGEVINLGSSGVGVGAGNAVLFSPTADVDTATPLLDCKVAQPGKGVMTTHAQEIAGPLPALGGYDPCTFTAPADGIYQVAFYGPDGKNGSTDPNSIPSIDTVSVSNPVITASQRSTVAMWDITVRSNTTSTADLSGRVFTDYVAMIMSSNDRQLKSDLYVLTNDGYQYQTALNGLDPNGFIFFASSQGLVRPNGQTLYRSARSSNPTDNLLLSLLGGITIQPPVHKMFFSLPANATTIALGYPTSATPPSPAQNFLFTGGTGGSGNSTPEGIGGTFSFLAPQDGRYQILIDTNNDGVYSISSGDRLLEGVAFNGSNVVTWDGTDNNGAILSARPGNAPYNSRIILKGGEYHFPLIDAETNLTGFRIEMLNPPGPFTNGANATTIYYDESNYSTDSADVTLGCGAPTTPCNASNGVDSASGGHRFATNYGDKKAIDTWIYFYSTAIDAPLIITATTKPKVSATKSVQFLTDNDGSGTTTVNDIVQYSITYSNLSPSTTDAINFQITDTLPSQLTFVSAQLVSKTAGNNLTLNSAYAGSGALTNSGTLRVGDSITLTINARINSQNNGLAILNQAKAKFGTPTTPTANIVVVSDADTAGSNTDTPTVGNFYKQVNDNFERGNDPALKNDDDATLFKVATVTPARVRLVKRITRINVSDITTVVDPTTTVDTNDDVSGWSSGYLRGAVDGGKVQPGDTVEYTIYFLSDGGVAAENVNICDLVPTNSTFVPNGFTAGSGIALAVGSATPTALLTNLADADGGQFIAVPIATPVPCSSTNATTNPNGAIVVKLGNSVPPANTDPINSYGFIRFRARVNGDPLLITP